MRCQYISGDMGKSDGVGGGKGVNCRILYRGGQSVSKAGNGMGLKNRHKLPGNTKKRSVH